MAAFDYLSNSLSALAGLCALFFLAIGIRYYATGRRSDLTALRQAVDDAAATDPQYNQARALYAATSIDGKRADAVYGRDRNADSDDSCDGD